MRTSLRTLFAAMVLTFALVGHAAGQSGTNSDPLYSKFAEAVEAGNDPYEQQSLYEAAEKDSAGFLKRLQALYDVDTAKNDELLRLSAMGVSIPVQESPSAGLVRKVKGALGEKFLAVLVDPGVASRIDAFLAFCSARKNCAEMSPFEARMAFARSLGDVVVYRGIKVSAKEMEKIREHGMVPAAYAKGFAEGKHSIISQIFEPIFRGGHFLLSYNDAVARTRSPDGSVSPLLAVSDSPIVAEGVGDYFGIKRADANLYVFKIKVPGIRHLSTGGLIRHRWDDYTQGAMRFWNPKTGAYVGKWEMNSPALESYLQGYVPPRWIESATLIKSPNVIWEDSRDNYRIYNWAKVNLSNRRSVDPKKSKIPFSPNDFFSVLRNKPDLIFNQTKLREFLRSSAGPEFKLELMDSLAAAGRSGLEASGEQVKMKEKAARFSQIMVNDPSYESTILQLVDDADPNVQYDAVDHLSGLLRKTFGFGGAVEAKLKAVLADEHRTAPVRVAAAQQLVGEFSKGRSLELTGLSPDQLLKTFQKVCPERMNQSDCIRILQRLNSLDPEVRSSQELSPLLQAMSKANTNPVVAEDLRAMMPKNAAVSPECGESWSGLGQGSNAH